MGELQVVIGAKLALSGYYLERYAIGQKTKGMDRSDHAKYAAGLFARVSMECPASVPAQAALIALDCKKAKAYSPRLLGLALLSEPQLIRRLEHAALNAHRNNPVALAAFKGYDDITRIIGEDFGFAQRLLTVSEPRLLDASTYEYQRYGSKGALVHVDELETLLELGLI